MELKIELKNDGAILTLISRNTPVDMESFEYHHDLEIKLTPLEAAYLKRFGYIKKGKCRVYKELLTGLITHLDKLLTRNGIDIVKLKEYNLISALESEATSVKIAEAVIAGLKS